MKLFSIGRSQRAAQAVPVRRGERGGAAPAANPRSRPLGRRDALELERAQDLLRAPPSSPTGEPGWELDEAIACSAPLERANDDVQALLGEILSTCCAQGRREGARAEMYLALAARCELPASPAELLLEDVEDFVREVLQRVRCAGSANEMQRQTAVNAALALHAKWPPGRRDGLEEALGMLVTHAVYSDSGPVAQRALFGNSRNRSYERAVDAISNVALRSSLYVALTSAFLDEQQTFGAAAWFPASANEMMEKLCKLVPEMPELGLRTHLVGMLRLYDKFKATAPHNLQHAIDGWRWNKLPNWKDEVDAAAILALCASADICVRLDDHALAVEVAQRFCALAEAAGSMSDKLDHFAEAVHLVPHAGSETAVKLLTLACAVDERALLPEDKDKFAILSFQLDAGCARAYRVQAHAPRSTTVEIPYPDWLLAIRMVLHEGWNARTQEARERTGCIGAAFAASAAHLEGPTRVGLHGPMADALASLVQQAEGPLVTPAHWHALVRMIIEAEAAQA